MILFNVLTVDVNISKILTFTILVTCYYNLSIFYIYVCVHINKPHRVVGEGFF